MNRLPLCASTFTRRASSPCLLLAILAATIAPRLSAQPLDAAFNPSPNAELYAVAVQPDGKILIGGNFSAIGTVARSRIARLNADGSVDPTFNGSINSTVLTIALQPDGKVLAGGYFNSVGGLTRNRIVRLNPDGSVDPTFNPNLDNGVTAIGNRVTALCIQPDGKILLGGGFTTIDGISRSGFARLNADGTLDASFDVPISGTFIVTNSVVDSITLQPDGRIVIAGNFTSVAGVPRAGLARLLPGGVLDLTFVPPAFGSNSRGALMLPDGKFIVYGNFGQLTANSQPFLVRLHADGTHDPAFNPTFIDGVAFSIVAQLDGKLVVGGAFTSIGGVRRGPLIRLNSDASVDTIFNPGLSGGLTSGASVGIVNGVVIPPGPPQIVAIGNFASAAGQPRPAIARFGTPLAIVTRQPVSVFVQAGASATLSVVAEGSSLRYQWRRNGSDIPGATHAVLVLAEVQAATAGVYTAIIFNEFGGVTTSPATVAVGSPPEPAYTVSTLAGSAGQIGHVDATGTAARFDRPTGLAVDAAGNVYTIDTVSNFVRKVSPGGAVRTLGILMGQGVAVDGAGIVYIADSRSRIMRITPSGNTSTFAGSATQGFADGLAASAQFDSPSGLAVDTAGNVYVADTGNNVVRRITPAGIVSTIAGRPGARGSVDGRGSDARFNLPMGLAVDVAGVLYVADRNRVRQITPDGLVSTFRDGTADAFGVATDAAGNVFVSEASAHTIRRFAPDGSFVTIGVVAASGSTDGAMTAVRFNSPWGIAVDRDGNLYIADNGNSTVRKATPGSHPLAITVPPATLHAAAGSRTTLRASASGASLSYQWKKDGLALAGATGAAYTLANPSSSDMGYYSVAVTSAGSTVESTAALLTVTNPDSPGRLVNVATRGFVPPGGDLTPGFILRGAGRKQLIVRGVGPTLLRFGLGGSLFDPRLQLAPLGGSPLLDNDDWSSGSTPLAAAAAAVGAFPLDPGSKDAAALATLNPTRNSNGYTVRITGESSADSGVALAEIYDADPLTSPVQFANVSTRGFVGTGANALIPGFVIGGSGAMRLLIRAVGPGLSPFGVTNLLADPQLAIVPLGKGTPLAANDNWGGTMDLRAAFAAVGAFSLPVDSKDAALLIHLPPGAYTVIVSGVGGSTGNGLVEIYDVP